VDLIFIIYRQYDDFQGKKEEYENYIHELEAENESLKTNNQKLIIDNKKISKIEKISSEIDNIKASFTKPQKKPEHVAKNPSIGNEIPEDNGASEKHSNFIHIINSSK